MNRPLVFTFLILFLIVEVSPDSEQKSHRTANRSPSIHSFTSSLAVLRICPFLPSAAVSDKPQVTLTVVATDPDGEALHYEYSSTEGAISGKGKSVVWDLGKVLRGPHEVHVTVTDGKGGKAQQALTVTTVDADACDPPPKPCPAIKVSCADELDHSKSFIFSAVVETPQGDSTTPSFKWTVNAGEIVTGQHSREITVTATRATGFDNITATVSVAGFDPSCAGTIVTCTTKILR